MYFPQHVEFLRWHLACHRLRLAILPSQFALLFLDLLIVVELNGRVLTSVSIWYYVFWLGSWGLIDTQGCNHALCASRLWRDHVSILVIPAQRLLSNFIEPFASLTHLARGYALILVGRRIQGFPLDAPIPTFYSASRFLLLHRRHYRTLLELGWAHRALHGGFSLRHCGDSV